MKKRLIFTLYYKNGFFCVSRNFRLQKVGDFNWLIDNFKLIEASNHFDELVLINLSDKIHEPKDFQDILRFIANNLFIPIAAGGGILNLVDAEKLIQVGADKVVINSLFFQNYPEVIKISASLGRQAIIFSLDYTFDLNYDFFYNNGRTLSKYDLGTIVNLINRGEIGECILTNIDFDGAGMGYDLTNANNLDTEISLPTIINGGGSTPEFVKSAFMNANSNAISISDLYNFMKSSISNLRNDLIVNGTPLPKNNLGMLK